MPPHPIDIRNCVLTHEGKEIPLISGELQYWRILREYWEPVILRAKELGLHVISSYVPWIYHETAPGVYDFHGATSPQRDLVGYIELLRRHDLHLIVRPGPYIYGSMPNGGVPDRASKLDRLDPEFLAMARHYMQAFAEVIRPHQITRGGNIILCQADNEPYPAIDNFGVEMGCFERDGLFKDWLRGKYRRDIGRLNAAWNTRLADFTEACVYFHEAYVDVDKPMADRLLRAPETFARYADTHEFVGWYAAKVVAEAKCWLREAGIDIPVFANGWSPLYQDFNQFCQVTDLTGIDVYPTPFFEGEEPVKDDWFYQMDILKLQEADVSNGNVWSAEYQGGTYPPEMGALPPPHFRFANRAFTAMGLKGWNWYILNTRGNWSCNPIMEFGEKNHSFAAVAGQNRLATELEPYHCDIINDISLLCYKPHRVSDPGSFKAFFDILNEADISFRYYNPVTQERPATNVLLYAGGDWIDEQSEQRLLAFVEAGGTLLAFNRYPRLRSDMKTPTRLGFVDPVGARPVTLPIDIRIGEQECRLTNAGHLGCKVNLFYHHAVPGRPLTARLGRGANEVIGGLVQSAAARHEFTIGYILERGQGRIVHIGANPSRLLLETALKELGVTRACHSTAAQTQSALHVHPDGRRILYLINRGRADRLCPVSIDLGRAGIDPRKAYRVSDPDTADSIQRRTGSDLASLALQVAGHDVAIRVIREDS